MENGQTLAGLLTRVINGETLTPEEQALLDYWKQEPGGEAAFAHITSSGYIAQELHAWQQAKLDETADKVFERLRAAGKLSDVSLPTTLPLVEKSRSNGFWVSLMVAATVVLLAIGSYLLYQQRVVKEAHRITAKTDIQPAKNKTVLILGDGRKVYLDSSRKRPVANEGNTQVIQLDSGLLAYNPQQAENSTSPVYNTIVTPKGGVFKVILADGSTVWLNAESSLRFPVRFTGKERAVEITGEAYFEVTNDFRHPFKVMAAGQTVEVLGTSFNVNAYRDEPTITTTLLTGSVRVNTGGDNRKLTPGQQAVNKQGLISVKADADIDAITAWVRGELNINDLSTEEVMRRIAKWYDVEVEFPVPFKTDHFMGKVPRDVPLSQVLNLLELTGAVNFKISGKKVYVYRNR